MSCFEKALQLDPHYAHAHSSLGILLQRRGDDVRALHHLKHALELRPDLHATHSCLLFMMSADPRATASEILAEHRRWGELHGHVTKPFVHVANSTDEERRLRIGYLSPDFRDHAVVRYFEPVLNAHQREQFEPFCYYNYHAEDHVSKRLKANSEWRTIWGLSDVQVAQQITHDKIDLLVDLAGHTAGNRLRVFAHKPAPVQFSWLGYPHTTGVPAIDYFVTNEIQDPPGESFHTEQLIRLSRDTCFEPPNDAPLFETIPSRQNGFLTLGSLHRPQKVSASVIELWGTLLNAIKSSRLLLFNTSFTKDSADAILSRLIELGIDPARCQIRRDPQPDGYLSMYREIDVALDVFPWSGGTTTREALWMGVPVVAFLGDRRSARSTAAVLHTLGYPQWIARDAIEYCQIVSHLNANEDDRLRLRLELRDRMRHTVCDAVSYTRELEAAFRNAWRTWCRS